MSPEVKDWMQLAFRWIHVVAGVTWIGHLYFFNWVNGPFAKTMDGPTKKAVVPQLMPRALYWFRWGAAWTFITGILLLGVVFYMGGGLMYEGDNPGTGATTALCVVAGLVAVFLYDVIQKAMKGSIPANALCVGLLFGIYFLMDIVGKFAFRALFIHIGGLLGTTMAMNVWMRIWPAQKKIITAVRDGVAPDAALVAAAGMRSRHNTYMSVPLIALMLNQHATALAGPLQPIYLAGIIAVGWTAVYLLYQKSNSVAGF